MKKQGGKYASNTDIRKTENSAGSSDAAEKRRQRKKQLIKKRRMTIILCAVLAVVMSVTALCMIFVKPPDISTNGEEDETKTSEDLENEGTKPGIELGGERKEDYYTFLVAGVDKDETRADVMMLVSYDVKNQDVNVMNIPRDTMVNTKRPVKKLNGAYIGGPEQLKEEVTNLLGVPIDRYVVVSFDGFVKIIDAIGGITFDVPMDMDYDDPTQDLHIHLKAGEQELSGEQALWLVRFRKNNNGGGYPGGDVQRIEMQKEFLKTVIKEVASFKNILKLNSIFDAVFENTTTDLTAGEIVWFGMRALSINTDEINMQTMPGYDKYLYEPDFGHNQSYYIPNVEETLEYMNLHLNPYKKDLTKMNTRDLSLYNTKPSTTSKETESTTAKPTESETTTAKPTESETTTAKPTESETTTARPTESETTTAVPTTEATTAVPTTEAPSESSSQ